MKKIKQFLSLQTKETRYAPYIIRLIIELIIFGGIDAFLFIIIPVENQALRLFVVLFLVICLWSIFACVIRCIAVSDNKHRQEVKGKKKTKEFTPISINREDFIYWLENAKLFEELVIKSVLGQCNTLEVTPEKKTLLYAFDGQEYKFDELISKLEADEYLNESIIVCETYDHNRPEILLEIIKDLKKKKK